MAENLSNDAQTLLNGSITNVATAITTTGNAGFPAANFRIRIDNEIMLVTSVGAGTNWTVTRAQEGTTGATHADQTPVVHVLTTTGLDNFIQDRLYSNLLVNPNFLVDQINEGGLYTVTGGGALINTVDGWTGAAIAAPGVFKIRQLADPDNAALKCMEITCTTIDAAIAAGDDYHIMQAVEGYDAASLMYGTAFARPATLTFNFKSNVTGVYGVSIRNSAVNRSYVAIITVPNTSENTYTISIPGDTSGTWLYTNGIGFYLTISLGTGSTFQAAAGAWSAGNFMTTSAQANFMSNVANVAYLKRIQLIPGPSSLPFAPQNYEAEFRKCQRYYEKSFPPGTAVAQNAGRTTDMEWVLVTGGAVATQAALNYSFKVSKRAAPTMTYYNPSAANAFARNLSASTDATATVTLVASTDNFTINVTGLAAWGIGNTIGVHWTANARLT